VARNSADGSVSESGISISSPSGDSDASVSSADNGSPDTQGLIVCSRKGTRSDSSVSSIASAPLGTRKRVSAPPPPRSLPSLVTSPVFGDALGSGIGVGNEAGKRKKARRHEKRRREQRAAAQTKRIHTKGADAYEVSSNFSDGLV
jgi:hypothetical protein